MKTFIIAEPGGTADGQLRAMKTLVGIAAAAGCDAFKNQWSSSADRMVARRRAPAYLAAYRALQYPLDWHRTLRNLCHDAGMQYGCSIYLPEDAGAIGTLVDFLKISSFEADDAALLTAASITGLPVWLSLGMGATPTVTQRQCKLLHCTSAYPAPIESLRLARLWNTHPSLALDYYPVDGLSDHSPPWFTWVGALAVAAGAATLETHMRSDDCRPDNPDYAVARNPRELAEYVRQVRFAEAALGDAHDFGAQLCEAPMQRFKVTA